MTKASEASVTALLQAWSNGSRDAGDELFRAVYDMLRRRAAQQLKRERPGHSLNPTALVHEAYFRVSRQANVSWQNRAQFLAVATRIMRRVLVDHARARLADKRPDDRLRVTLEEHTAFAEVAEFDVIAFDKALDELEGMDPRQTQIVALRYLDGLSVDETAHVLEISAATVKREWKFAKAWLRRQLEPKAGSTVRPQR